MKMISKLLAGSVAAILLTTPALAQDVKIGVVNIQRVLSESPQLLEAQEKLKDEFSPRERELIAMQTAFEEKVAKLQKDAEVMGADERAAAERELGNEQRTIVRGQNEVREDLELRRNELLAPVQQAIIQNIQDYAEKQGYDIVFAEGIVYANSKVDITAQVLDALKAGK
jgi:outer membrane protein